MSKISKKISQLYSYALISLSIGFGSLYMFTHGQISIVFVGVALPAFATGIYFLKTAYHRTNKELNK